MCSLRATLRAVTLNIILYSYAFLCNLMQDWEYKALIEGFKKNEFKYVAYNIAAGQLFIQISKEDAKS